MNEDNDPDVEQERREWEAKLTRAALRDDVQEFLQVYNLGNVLLSSVVVRYIETSGDFTAQCQVQRSGRKNWRKVSADAPGRAQALETLAAKVAELLYPVDRGAET